MVATPRTSLSAIAQRLGVERHSLERAVRRVTGKNFRQLQAEAVLRKAVDLLALEPSRSVKEISFLLGYKSSRAFSRFVRRASGNAPRELRRSMLPRRKTAGKQSSAT